MVDENNGTEQSSEDQNDNDDNLEANGQIEDNDDSENKIIWSSHQLIRKNKERRVSSNRRHFVTRGITVPDMRGGVDRRTGEDRRKVKLTITGRAIDV